jgi:short-subunit dehydrogenase
VSVTQIMPEAVNTPFFEHARTRLGVRPSGPPPVTSPERVGRAILHAAEHGGRDITVGFGGKLQLALQRVSPRIMDTVGRVTFPLQRSREPKGVGDDTLFDTPHADDDVHGVVTTTHR